MSDESCTDLQAWVAQLGGAAPNPTHMAALVKTAQATVQAVAAAAQALDWLDADAFAHTLQALEYGDGR